MECTPVRSKGCVHVVLVFVDLLGRERRRPVRRTQFWASATKCEHNQKLVGPPRRIFSPGRRTQVHTRARSDDEVFPFVIHTGSDPGEGRTMRWMLCRWRSPVCHAQDFRKCPVPDFRQPRSGAAATTAAAKDKAQPPNSSSPPARGLVHWVGAVLGTHTLIHPRPTNFRLRDT